MGQDWKAAKAAWHTGDIPARGTMPDSHLRSEPLKRYFKKKKATSPETHPNMPWRNGHGGTAGQTQTLYKLVGRILALLEAVAAFPVASLGSELHLLHFQGWKHQPLNPFVAETAPNLAPFPFPLPRAAAKWTSPTSQQHPKDKTSKVFHWDDGYSQVAWFGIAHFAPQVQ